MIQTQHRTLTHRNTTIGVRFKWTRFFFSLLFCCCFCHSFFLFAAFLLFYQFHSHQMNLAFSVSVSAFAFLYMCVVICIFMCICAVRCCVLCWIVVLLIVCGFGGFVLNRNPFGELFALTIIANVYRQPQQEMYYKLIKQTEKITKNPNNNSIRQLIIWEVIWWKCQL